MAKARTEASLRLKSCIREVSILKPNQTMAHSLIKKIGRNTKKRNPKATARPGRVWTNPTKKTYFAQNKDVPGKPIVTRTPRTDISHSDGADKASPPR
jgi:hypothetical protein